MVGAPVDAVDQAGVAGGGGAAWSSPTRSATIPGVAILNVPHLEGPGVAGAIPFAVAPPGEGHLTGVINVH